ncbi:MAG: hypothetical protein K9M44_04270 [Candidatus Pacebacteria bacterium]|nr:hypothetical protein [Candidatus Paceibacterota bacterium]
MSKILEQMIKARKQVEFNRLDAIKAVNKLFSKLKDREQDVLTRRYGLHGQKKETLDSIGKSDNLTRERVRQIESASLAKLRKLDSLEEYIKDIRQAVTELLHEHGGLMRQEYLLDILIMSLKEAGQKTLNDSGYQNLYRSHFDFLISKLLHDDVNKMSGADNFLASYKLKNMETPHFEDLVGEAVEKIKSMNQTVKTAELLEILKQLENYKKHEDKISNFNQNDLSLVFANDIFPEEAQLINQNKVLYSFLESIKHLDRNKFGEWGLSDWREIKPKTINDKIYLVLKHNEKPMHFTEIAERINEVGFDKKKANAATVHNELILDDRYELVGRGLYGLKAWR